MMRSISFHFLSIAIVAILGVFSMSAQDIPFSQFYVNPTYLNPASVGDIDEDFRFTSNYKNQWRSISDPFKSVALTYDMAFYQDLVDKQYFGLGLSYFNDKAGSTGLRLNLYSLSMSYSTRLDRYNSISFGMVGNYGRRSIDFSSVRWENQHNGNNYDPTLPSGEVELSERYNYWDFGTGIRWTYDESNLGFHTDVGLSVFHLNQPNQSFIIDKSERLKRKYQLHTFFEFNGETFNLLPQLLVTKQENIYSFTIGSMIELKPDEQAESRYTDFNVVSYMSFGAHYRYRDAIILSALYDYKHFLRVGLSYDITVSRLNNFNRARGGFEISIVYNGAFGNDKIKVKNKTVKEKDRLNLRKDSRNL